MNESLSGDDYHQPEDDANVTTVEKPVKTVWGGWGTLGFSLLMGMGILVAQGVLTFAYVIGNYGKELILDSVVLMETLLSDSMFIVLSLALQAIVGVGLILGFIAARKNATVKDYLALHKISWKTTGLTLVITLVLLSVMSFTEQFFNLSDETDFIMDAFLDSSFPILLVIAVVIMAPLFEELFFRGFLYAGWSQSRLGVNATIVLTSVLWSVQHVQYSWYGILQIFVMGIVLGWLRKKTGSIYPPLLMHAVWNMVATLPILLYINGAIG
jgi:CAAX protease family protein